VKKEKKSLLDKIIPRRLHTATSTLATPSCISGNHESKHNHNGSGGGPAPPNFQYNTTTGVVTSSNVGQQQQQQQQQVTTTPLALNTSQNKSDANINFIGKAVVKHKYTAVK
jgi:hypothetical protein